MKIGLALGGGGIRGIAHIGVIRSLLESGIEIGAIAGTSAGAIVAALAAAGCSPEEMLALFDKADQDRLFGRHPNDGPSLMGVAGLMRLLGKRFGDLSFSDLKIPFACSAVDYKSGREIVLHDGCVLDAVIASSAMPGIFPPRTIGYLELVDGGMLDPVPVEIVRWLEPRLPIVAVVLSPPQEQWARVPSFQVPRNRSIPSLIADQFSHLRLARALQIFIDSTDISLRMLTELRLKSDAPDLVIRPDVCQWPLLAKVNPGELVQTGSDAAAAQMPRIKKLGSWTYGFFGRRRISSVPRLS